jgi:hypothetical protein
MDKYRYYDTPIIVEAWVLPMCNLISRFELSAELPEFTL